MLNYNKKLKPYSRKLRNEMTDAERLLWKHIRYKKIINVQFYRQKIIGNYIVDFYAPSVKIIIELDGGQHFLDTHLKKDKERDDHLSSLHFKVLRFDNWQVLKSLGDVLNEILREIEIRKPRM